MASLFYFSYAVFLIWIIIGIGNLRQLNLREALMAVIGFGTVYFLAGSIYHLLDAFDYFAEQQWRQALGFCDLRAPVAGSWWQIVPLLLLLVYTLTQWNWYMAKTTIDVRKKIDFLYAALLLSPLIVVFQAGASLSTFLAAALPLGVFLGFSFVKARAAYAEAVHFLLLAAVLCWQFRSVLGW